ncbi:MAG: hypothetical protein ACRDTH_28965 [Pseudonocardiaceae bacterium]
MDDVLTANLVAPASWEQIRTEFRSRSFVTLRQMAITIPGLDVDGLDRLLDPHRRPSPTKAEMAAPLGRAFSAVATRPGALPVLAALVYGFCLNRWEHSTDHAAVAAMATSGQDACAALHVPADGDGNGSGWLAARVLLDLAYSLISCMKVENALNCSCPIDMQRHAQDAVTAADHVLASLPADPADDGPITGFIRQAAQAQVLYFGGVLRVAEAVEAFVTDPETSVERLTAAIDAAEATESEPALRDDVYESELRAHRMTLAAMVRSSTAPVLHIDKGKIAYCYPFAVIGVAQSEDVVRGVEALQSGQMLGSARVADVGKLNVTDAWEANDPEERAYTGAMATLNDLLIVTTAGEQLPAHHVELRVSKIGICYLRIWTWMADISAHELNQAMRRGSVQMGAETIRQGGPVAGKWSRLAEYAEEVIVEFERHLATVLGAQPAPSGSQDSQLRVLFSVERRHHTVVSLRAFSQVNLAGGWQRLYSYADALGTVGATLLHQRINHAAATLEEYVRNPSRTPHALVDDIGFQGEALTRTVDSTVITMPTSPNFIVIGYEEMAEFSAALPALFDQWIALIYEQRRSLSTQLQSIEEMWRRAELSDQRSSQLLSEQVHDLDQRQAQLRDAVGEARSMLAFLKSPTLCRASKYRDVLDMLFDAAGVGHLEAQTAKVDALYVQVQARADQLEERQTQRSRTWVEVALAFLAVTSLAEFFGLVNDAFVKRPLFLEVGVILVAAVVVTLVAMRSHRRSSDGRDRTGRYLSRR